MELTCRKRENVCIKRLAAWSFLILLLLPAALAQTGRHRDHQTKGFRIVERPYYRYWLDDDVRWIITEQERAAFMRLQNDAERDLFMENFWSRRDPTPDTHENEYKDEYYRRLAYANDHFGNTRPGHSTDRGRIYAMFGKPDAIFDWNDENGVPIQRWRYRYIEDVGQEQIVEFRDPCRCNEFRIVGDPTNGKSLWDFMSGQDGFHFHEQYGLQRPPAVRFKDLEEVIAHRISMNLLPLQVRTASTSVTRATDLVTVIVSIRKSDATWKNVDGTSRARLEIFGRVTSISGRVVDTIETSMDLSTPSTDLHALADSANASRVLALRPGRYRLDFAVRDVIGDRVGTWSNGITVPDFEID